MKHGSCVEGVTTPEMSILAGGEHKAYPFGVFYQDAFPVYPLSDILPFVSSNIGIVRSFLSGLEQ